MFDSHVELKYKNDNTFRQVVDTLRALLGAYHITSGELREAAVLAATMHEMENVRPLLIKPWDNYPCMFGGEPKAGLYIDLAGCTDTSTPESRALATHKFYTTHGFKQCIYCSLSEPYIEHFKVSCKGKL